MSCLPELDWNELLQLHVVKKVEKLMAKRWGLGFGYLDVSRESVLAPRLGAHATLASPCSAMQDSASGKLLCTQTAQCHLAHLQERDENSSSKPYCRTCHAGWIEIIAPIVVNDKVIGALLCGGYREEEASEPAELSETAPSLGEREVSFVLELLEEAAAEISSFLIASGKHAATDKALAPRDHYESSIGSSAPMQALYGLLDKVVAADSTVLVTGENGTGKELVARAIHVKSERKNQPFVVHNCSAFNDNLIDSELFGHKRGAFTGAVTDKPGLFEVADGGTFFLDEIGDMSPTLQVKVLRVLQEGTFTPVGSTATKHVDVRIVAATNRDLQSMVSEGTFREDLYYRINVINIRLPTLRERTDDLEQLIEHFLRKHRGGDKRLSQECLTQMRNYRWPGNVRELENEVERLVVLSGNSELLGAELLSARMRGFSSGVASEIESATGSLPDAVRALEKRMIRQALREQNWNKTRAAVQLKVSRRNLIRLVQKYDLEKERDTEALA